MRTNGLISNPTLDRPRGTRFMRPKTEKRADVQMRFFTPELYLRFNSDEEVEADRADEAWEKATDDYRRHLKAFRKTMPASVRAMTERCLHDFELLSFHEEFKPAAAVLSLGNGSDIRIVVYTLWDRVRRKTGPRSWPFSKAQKHWLYDEIDVANQSGGRFVHRILSSDGSIVQIPFSQVFVDHFALPINGSRPRTKRRAS